MATQHETIKVTEPKLTGAVLKGWRERMGYSEREAARALGCSRGAWSGWEADKNEAPRYIGLAMGALALGMKPYSDEPPAPQSGEQ